MRHIIRIVAFAVALGAAGAPAWSEAVWTLEFVGGMDVAQLSGDDTRIEGSIFESSFGNADVSGDVGGTRIGFVVGALATVYFGENFGLQSGLIWSRKGGDGRVSGVGDLPGYGPIDLDFDVTLTLDYIELPLLGVVSFPVDDVTSVRMMAGPVFAFNTNSSFEFEISGNSSSTDIGDAINTFDFAGLLGVGVEMSLGGVSFIADARYTRGFTSIADAGDADIKNSDFKILAGISVPVGPR